MDTVSHAIASYVGIAIMNSVEQLRMQVLLKLSF